MSLLAPREEESEDIPVYWLIQRETMDGDDPSWYLYCHILYIFVFFHFDARSIFIKSVKNIDKFVKSFYYNFFMRLSSSDLMFCNNSIISSVFPSKILLLNCHSNSWMVSTIVMISLAEWILSTSMSAKSSIISSSLVSSVGERTSIWLSRVLRWLNIQWRSSNASQISFSLSSCSISLMSWRQVASNCSFCIFVSKYIKADSFSRRHKKTCGVWCRREYSGNFCE